ncbi:MAG TPA: SDR family NAD(P)-dependent oxidoreductase [Pseudomonadales bacterium]|nr:SDR family NAD(P)-dependent oxidoreductase [Pseudomonadales bacterium]
MSNRRFEGKVGVVTGGASGIGLAITRRLVAEGAKVVVGDINDASLASAAREFGDAIACAKVDVRIEAEVEAMAATATRRFGRLDVAFNAAGLGGFGEITELAEADWDLVVDICLKGVFLSVKHEARAMIAQRRGGAIVNVASLNSHVPMYGGVAYCCAKAGVEMLSRNAALELAPKRVRINTISPGLTDTPLTAAMHNIAGVEGAYMDRIPMKRWGTPDDMAAAALFLASDDAGYITGSNLFVDGGWETTGYPNLQPFVGQLVS